MFFNKALYRTRNFNYDALKAFAIILMIIDHIGAYFLPEQNLLRIIGRAAAPIFFFLIAFSNCKKTDNNLLTLGVALIVLNFILSDEFTPNILISLYFLRFLNLALSDYNWRLNISDVLVIMFFNVILFPHLFMLEYSFLAFIPYILGHIVRTKHENSDFFIIAFALMYFGSLNILCNITNDTLFLMSLIFTTFVIMSKTPFKHYQFPAFHNKNFKPSFINQKKVANKTKETSFIIKIKEFLKEKKVYLNDKIKIFFNLSVYFFGKYALQIYFIHYTLFKTIAFII